MQVFLAFLQLALMPIAMSDTQPEFRDQLDRVIEAARLQDEKVFANGAYTADTVDVNDILDVINQAWIDNSLPTISDWATAPASEASQEAPQVILTDFEPDDVLALMLWRGFFPNAPFPILLFPVNRKKKDIGTVLMKKLVMATAGLGVGMLRNLYLLDHESPKHAARNLESVAEKAKHRASEVFGAVSPQWVIQSPGFGNVSALMAAVGNPELKCPVEVYSGAYNFDPKNMTNKDLRAIQKKASTVHDSARVIFTEDAPWSRTIIGLWDGLEAYLNERNPVFVQAWIVFEQEFSGPLIGPGNWGLFNKKKGADSSKLKDDAPPKQVQDTLWDLTETQLAVFREHVEPLFATSVQQYAKALLNPTYGLESKLSWKVAQVKNWAQNKRQGALADILLPMGVALRKAAAKQMMSFKTLKGFWYRNDEGYSLIPQGFNDPQGSDDQAQRLNPEGHPANPFGFFDLPEFTKWDKKAKAPVIYNKLPEGSSAGIVAEQLQLQNAKSEETGQKMQLLMEEGLEKFVKTLDMTPAGNRNGGISTAHIVLIVVGAAGVFVVVILLLCCLLGRERSTSAGDAESSESSEVSAESS